MSAFICGNDHIDALLTYAIAVKASFRHPISENRIDITDANADTIGKWLMQENERSVGTRYRDPGDGSVIRDMAGDEHSDNYRYRFWSLPLTAVSVLKGCDCFDYQACETDDYEQSVAYAIIEGIRGHAIRRLTGYSDAPGWEFRRPALKVAS